MDTGRLLFEKSTYDSAKAASKLEQCKSEENVARIRVVFDLEDGQVKSTSSSSGNSTGTSSERLQDGIKRQREVLQQAMKKQQRRLEELRDLEAAVEMAECAYMMAKDLYRSSIFEDSDDDDCGASK